MPACDGRPPLIGHWPSTNPALSWVGRERKAAFVAKFAHLTLKDALEQSRMKEFMAQYKGVKAGGAAFDKRAKQDADAPQPRRKKAARTR